MTEQVLVDLTEEKLDNITVKQLQEFDDFIKNKINGQISSKEDLEKIQNINKNYLIGIRKIAIKLQLYMENSKKYVATLGEIYKNKFNVPSFAELSISIVQQPPTTVEIPIVSVEPKKKKIKHSEDEKKPKPVIEKKPEPIVEEKKPEPIVDEKKPEQVIEKKLEPVVVEEKKVEENKVKPEKEKKKKEKKEKKVKKDKNEKTEEKIEKKTE